MSPAWLTTATGSVWSVGVFNRLNRGLFSVWTHTTGGPSATVSTGVLRSQTSGVQWFFKLDKPISVSPSRKDMPSTASCVLLGARVTTRWLRLPRIRISAACEAGFFLLNQQAAHSIARGCQVKLMLSPAF